MRGLLQGDGLGNMGGEVFSPGEDGCGGGIRAEKISTGTRLRLWNAKRLLTSYKTSVSTVGFQGPLRNIFTLLPPLGCASTGLKTGMGSAPVRRPCRGRRPLFQRERTEKGTGKQQTHKAGLSFLINVKAATIPFFSKKEDRQRPKAVYGMGLDALGVFSPGHSVPAGEESENFPKGTLESAGAC